MGSELCYSMYMWQIIYSDPVASILYFVILEWDQSSWTSFLKNKKCVKHFITWLSFLGKGLVIISASLYMVCKDMTSVWYLDNGSVRNYIQHLILLRWNNKQRSVDINWYQKQTSNNVWRKITVYGFLTAHHMVLKDKGAWVSCLIRIKVYLWSVAITDIKSIV